MTQLLDLKQSCTISTYHDKFEILLGRVKLPEEYAINFFLSGLKPVIQHQVKMFMPKTLNQAYTLAELQETSLKTLQQELNFSQKKPHLLSCHLTQTKLFQKNPTTNINTVPDQNKPFQKYSQPFFLKIQLIFQSIQSQE